LVISPSGWPSGRTTWQRQVNQGLCTISSVAAPGPRMCRVIGRVTSQLVNNLVKKASGDWVACTTAPICRPLESSTV